jgi:hypothetical protein
MRTFLKITFLVTFLSVLAGCSSGTKVDPKDHSVSVVYGYFDMSDAPSNLEWVSIKKYDAESEDDEYAHAGVEDGMFWHVGIKPGSYQVEKFGGTGGVPMLTQQGYSYNFGTKGRNETAVRIKSSGTYFLGSYKYTEQKDGTFEMKPNKQHGEKEILKKLVKIFEKEKSLRVYTHQLNMIKRKLASEK